MREEEIRAEHFREAEASLLLEGLDLATDEFYQATKARVIAGEIDAREMMRLVVADSKTRYESSAPRLATAS